LWRAQWTVLKLRPVRERSRAGSSSTLWIVAFMIGCRVLRMQLVEGN
jgi:hypothetical protein